MESLPFTYMDLEQVLNTSPIRSKSQLYAAIKRGDAPAPDRIGGRSLWRSDKIAAWMLEQSEMADLERQQRSDSSRSNRLAKVPA